MRLKMLVDHREVGVGREHAARGALVADLSSKLGADAVEARSLPLGDVLWVWQHEDSDTKELIAGWVIERKTFSDLSASIVDGRYDEQKLRLLEAPGVEGVIYLIEGAEPLFGVGECSAGSGDKPAGTGGRGFGQRLLRRTLPTSTLSTTAVHTQLITGFQSVHTVSTSHTITFLMGMHASLLEQGPGAQLGKGAVTYHDFADRTRKTCHSRAIEIFGKMLRVMPHFGPEATEALVNEFQTPHALAAALRDHSDSELVLQLKTRHGGRRAPISAAALAACRELFVI